MNKFMHTKLYIGLKSLQFLLMGGISNQIFQVAGIIVERKLETFQYNINTYHYDSEKRHIKFKGFEYGKFHYIFDEINKTMFVASLDLVSVGGSISKQAICKEYRDILTKAEKSLLYWCWEVKMKQVKELDTRKQSNKSLRDKFLDSFKL